MNPQSPDQNGAERLDKLVREKVDREKIPLEKEREEKGDHLKRLLTRIQKLISQMEAIQLALADKEIVKHGADEARKEVQELLARLYLAHQDQQLTEQQANELDYKYMRLSQQFPHFLNERREDSRN